MRLQNLKNKKPHTSFIDLISRENAHYMFNLSILYEVSKSSLKVDTNFYSINSNLDIFTDVKKLNIKGVKIKERYNYLITTIFAFYQSIIFNKSKKYILLAFDNSLISLLFLVNYFILFFQKKEFTIILHNNLSAFKNENWKKNLFSFFLKHYNPKIIVLSPFMLKEFNLIFNYSNVNYCFHQNYKELVHCDFVKLRLKKMKKKRTVVSISNSHSKIFRRDNIFKYLNELEDKNVVINYIGEFNDVNSQNFNNKKRPGSIIDYYNYIHNSEYMFFPKDEESNLRASGVLIDALSLGVNFIAPNVGHFKDVNETFGIGILYDNYEELIKIFSTLYKVEVLDSDFFMKNTLVSNLIKEF